MKITGKYKTTSEGEKFFRTLSEAGNMEVAAGFFEGDSYDNGASVAEIAAYNEFGTSKIPPRPFMEQAFEGKSDEIRQAAKEAYECIVEGDDLQTAYNIIGACLQGVIRDEIDTGDFAPNSPATTQRKGSDKPLTDTGRMRQSVRYRIRKKGGGGK